MLILRACRCSYNKRYIDYLPILLLSIILISIFIIYKYYLPIFTNYKYVVCSRMCSCDIKLKYKLKHRSIDINCNHIRMQHNISNQDV